jgi:hypothetical protein
MKFFWKTLLGSSLFFLASVVTLLCLFRSTDAEWQRFSLELKKTKNPQILARQERTHVQKEILFSSKENERLVSFVRGEKSELIFDPKRSGFFEKMETVSGAWQESFSGDERLKSTFFADSAEYVAKDGTFFASDVLVKRVLIPSDAPLMEGRAEEIVFSLDGNFLAKKFRASISKGM